MLKQIVPKMAALFIIATTSISNTAQSDGLVVVVNRDNPVTSLSKGDLRSLFLTLKMTWPDGSDVIAVNLPESNELRQDFDRAVLGLSPEDVAKYWIDRRIRGGARPPKKAPTTLSVLKVVSASSGAVGYIHRSEVNKNLKIVAVIRNGTVSGS